jgi:Tfp pilus assembly protein PilO
MSMTRKWSLLAAALVVAIMAASWFLLISPKRGEAADLRSKSAAQEQANQLLQQKLEQLKAQAVDLPKQKAQLALIRKQIPDNPALPTLVRDLTAAARKVGVDLVSLAPANPVAMAPAAAQAPVPATTTGGGNSTGTTGSSGTTGTGSPAAAAPATPPATLYMVPLKVTLSGSYFEVEQFVNKLEGLRRSFLVTGFSLTPGGEETSSTGGSTDSSGELKLALDGRVFLSPSVVPAAATPTPAASSASGTTTAQ